MVRNYNEDDLFKHTSMTFGEHLEELRSSLLKAVLSLTVGFCIGLYFAPDIVRLVQTPLERALKKFYSEEAIEYLNARLPEELRGNEEMQRRVLEEGLEPQEMFISPREVLAGLQKKYPSVSVDLPKTAQPGPAKEPAMDSEKTAAETSAAPASDKIATAAKAPADSDLVRIFLWRRLSDDERLKVESFNVQESFMIYIKAAFLAGAVLSSPFAFYFLWSFVAAGLYPHEKRYVHLFLPISVGLFLCGAVLAFLFVFPPVLNFFFGITKSMNQGIRPRISEWLSFVLMLPLGFGISFQLPLLMLFLERIRVFDVGMYISKWRIAVLLIAIASMVLSPGGDPYSMLMMLVPLILLYFGGIGLCKWLPSDRDKESLESKAYAAVD